MPLTGRRRRALFYGLALALPWLFLLLVEVGLRIGGYGSSYPLFIRHATQPDYLVANPAVAWRYFGKGPFVPTPELDLFRARKQPGTYRIFMQGESSAQGYPYGHGGAPSRMLEQRLQAANPGREIEVVNTALTAVNSWTLLDQADEIIAQQPDAVIIYTGHNEYYGAFGVGSTRSFGGWRSLVKAKLMLRHWRTAQLMDAMIGGIIAGMHRSSDTTAPRSVMQLMAGEQRIPRLSAMHLEGIDQFRANLGELLARYHARGIPVFIGTLASNERDLPPLVSGLSPGTDSTAWMLNYRAAVDALEHGDTAAARRSLDATASLDSVSALVLYAYGRLLLARGDTAHARTQFRGAKDWDELPFRAPEAMNTVIREEAKRHGAMVIETQQALEQHAPGGIIGNTLMLEHLHPNIDGYFIIAEAFFEALQPRASAGAAAIAIPSAQARADIPVTAVDSLIGLYRTDRLTAGWPFQPKGAERIPIVDTLHPTSQVPRLAQAVVIGNLPWPEATERLRAETERSGDYAQSIRAARALAQEYSYSAEPWMDAARVALLEHRYDEALRYVTAANRRHETASSAELAGLLTLRQGNVEAALPQLKRAVALAPGDERIALSLRAAGEIPRLEQRRARAPRDTVILYDLSGAYALTQQYEKARETLGALTRVAPKHAGARSLMARLPQ